MPPYSTTKIEDWYTVQTGLVTDSDLGGLQREFIYTVPVSKSMVRERQERVGCVWSGLTRDVSSSTKNRKQITL